MMTVWKIMFFLTQAVAVATASYAACSASPSCSGLVGDCCPTSSGVHRKCTVLPKQQIVFDIMLTSNFLRYSYNIVGCCDSDPVDDASCSANAACNSLGLTGTCCPTTAGDYVSIITAYDDVFLSKDCGCLCTYLSEKSDIAHRFVQCQLDCCSDDGSPDTDPVVDASCAANSACNSLGLTGTCCPTTAGDYVSIIHSI
jgi:hypothetical protein